MNIKVFSALLGVLAMGTAYCITPDYPVLWIPIMALLLLSFYLVRNQFPPKVLGVFVAYSVGAVLCAALPYWIEDSAIYRMAILATLMMIYVYVRTLPDYAPYLTPEAPTSWVMRILIFVTVFLVSVLYCYIYF